MTASLWDAQFEYWISKLSEPGCHLTRVDREDLRPLFTDDEWQEAKNRRAELEAEMAEELDGYGQLEPSKLSDTLLTLIRNIEDTQNRHAPAIRKARAIINERLGYIEKSIQEAKSFYENLPPEEKALWAEPELDEDDDWHEVPYPVDKWTGLRPDLVSPNARALLEILERKRRS